jgi:YHS domain-containing protein
MADVSNLLNRIDAEFTALDQKIKQSQTEQVEAHRESQKRLEAFAKVLDELQGLWRPRLEALAKKFGDRVKVTPRLTPSSREAVFEFQSSLAHIRLKFSAYTDRDVQNLILANDLEIIPVLMRFDGHSETTAPLNAIDKEVLTRWLDDRIVAFVRTYLSLHENDYYLKDHMVEDPVVRVRFPKYAAAATLQQKGKTYYFISEETRKDFEKQQATASK